METKSREKGVAYLQAFASYGIQVDCGPMIFGRKLNVHSLNTIKHYIYFTFCWLLDFPFHFYAALLHTTLVSETTHQLTPMPLLLIG